MKGSDGSAIRKGMKLMKRRLRFKITAKLGNSKGQQCSRQKYIYIYIYIYVCVCVCVCVYMQSRDHCSKKTAKENKMER